MVNVFQNGDNKYSKSKQNHKFLVCTHKKASPFLDARNGGIHTLSAPQVNILHFHGAVKPKWAL